MHLFRCAEASFNKTSYRFESNEAAGTDKHHEVNKIYERNV